MRRANSTAHLKIDFNPREFEVGQSKLAGYRAKPITERRKTLPSSMIKSSIRNATQEDLAR